MLFSSTHTITSNLSPSITSDLTSLRVAILSLGGLGGSGKVATELARELTTAGAKVILLTSPQAQWVSNDELNYIPVSAPKTPTPADSKWIVPLAQEIIQHVETNNIDVLNVHYAVGLVEAALEARQELASRGYSLSVCLTLHGSDVNKYGCDSNYNAQLRDCILACDCVTAVSNSLALQAVRIFSLPWRPIVIHNAIDLEVFHPFRRWIAAPSDTLNLCHVSNFRDVKRPLDAISVLAHVRGAGVPARLIMIGNGPNYIRGREYAEELGVANEVIFLGAVSPTEVVRWLAVTDLQLVTSESESFCLAALEAMACEVPVVGTYCGGLEEIMAILDVDMPAKLLSAPGDTTAMAAKIVQLFNTPSNYQKLRDSLRDKIQLHFSRKAQLQAYCNILMGIIA
ncbi:glycosyltransferase [Dulcicalothrix desertica]|uniref:glycosyltransferase n=1 Tax=Dulcicalothrix desertica TaxID=32056 RepID=UPI000F8C96F7|nr:glycosyltransferase [Dulcicalothrix desertica]TWH54972.1 N-acetyl-alpha-D-glucosaminyl L-malate synthase BshA [Dulcicalothrix desertica PCC 7102]